MRGWLAKKSVKDAQSVNIEDYWQRAVCQKERHQRRKLLPEKGAYRKRQFKFSLVSPPSLCQTDFDRVAFHRNGKGSFMRGLLTTAVAGIACFLGNLCWGQGLVSQLPADGTWVRFEGTYSQVEIRPETAAGKVEIDPWIEHVTIKSVGEELAEYRGETVPCRWIEIKIERGRERDGKVDTGLTGLEIYKVLIPEATVIASNVDVDGVPISFLPLVKGFRKVGKADPKPLTEPALQLYPLGILVGYYRELKIVGEDVDAEVGLGAIKATQLQGEIKIERPNSRTVQESTIWKSKDVAFGVARWSAKMIRERKDDQSPRSDFKPVSEVTIEMQAKEAGQDAKSELNVP